jgi:hypothetical protein
MKKAHKRQVSAAEKASGLEKGQYQVRVESQRGKEAKMLWPKMPNPRPQNKRTELLANETMYRTKAVVV